MQKTKLLVVSIVLFLWVLPVYSGEKHLTLATLDWEPYIGQKLKNQGYVAEIIRESFKRVGYTVEIVFYPWVRAVNMAQNGTVDGCFPEYFSKAVEVCAVC